MGPIFDLEKQTTCLVCGGNQSESLYEVLLRCRQCGFVRADGDVSQTQIRELYDKKYFFGEEYADYLKEEKALRKNFRRNLKIISEFLSSGRLFEVGCAYGFFLDEARKHYEVEGIEINKEACRYARNQLNLNVMCGDFLEQEFPENHYDVVVMWATIEHLKDPDLYVRKVGRLLRSGGIFVCTAPDIGSMMARIQKRKWRQIHPPTHLNYFSRETLGKFLDNHGLRLIKTIWPGEYRTFNQAFYIMLVLRNKMEGLYRLLDRLRLTEGVFYLNTYDQICVVARKEEREVVQ
jgi:SAM-dependent methyltransferase